ncbi:MAG: hypothetical protein E3J72_14995 [Planctomycetota bacterium]|nr:MAG: hypothetical protein E3J72_14995 [Planctomycetota bacterium]
MKSAVRKRIPAICLMMAILFLAVSLMPGGCRKKKKKLFFPPPPAPERPEVGGTVYNAAASVGDLLSYQINTGTLEYSYAVMKGEYFGDIGCGSLIPMGGFGPNVYTTSGNDTVVLLPDKLALIGTDNGWLIAGVPEVSGSYTFADIGGYYNYVGYEIDEDTGVPEADYGTLHMDRGTYKVWFFDDGATTANPPDVSGTWFDKGNGILDFYWGIIKIGYIMIYPSVNGNILIIDMAVNNGIVLGVKQQPVTSGNFDGTYDVLDTMGSPLDTVTIAGTSLTGALGSRTLIYDIPWTGMITDGADFTGLLNPEGIFFGVLTGTPSAIAGIME